MSALPNNTFASPNNPFYALAGGGGGDTLQSPVSLVPEAGGNQQLNIVASTGSGEANLLVSSTNGNDATIIVNSTQGGNATIALGQSAVPGGSGIALLLAPGAVVGGGQMLIQNGSGATPPVAVFDTVNNGVYLGGATTAGLTTIRNGLQVNDDFVTAPATNGIGITMTSAHVGVIAGTDNTGVTNTLQIGSSQNAIDIITLTDTGANTAQCFIGGNGGANLAINGGTIANPAVGVNLRTDAGSSGVMTIGSSVANVAGLTVSDVGRPGIFNYVQVGGTTPNPPLLLIGAQGSAGACSVRPDCAAGSGSLVLGSDNDNPDQVVITNLGITVNQDTLFTENVTIPNILNFFGTGAQAGKFGAIEGMNSYFAGSVVCGDNAAVSIPQPTGPGGIPMETGLYFILGRKANGTLPLAPWMSVSAMGYWSSVAGLWTWGGGGCCPAFITAPPSFVGIQGGGATLTLANGGGLGTVTMDFTFQQIGGILGGLG